jgi:structural maintenance of chromosome 3 (chondroitin sulfate proteoglycan 6)
MLRVQGVAKSFREIFRDLAPGGRGEVVMQKRVHSNGAAVDGEDGVGSGGEEREGDAAGGISEKYAGVKVKVRAPDSRV